MQVRWSDTVSLLFCRPHDTWQPAIDLFIYIYIFFFLKSNEKKIKIIKKKYWKSGIASLLLLMLLDLEDRYTRHVLLCSEVFSNVTALSLLRMSYTSTTDVTILWLWPKKKDIMSLWLRTIFFLNYICVNCGCILLKQQQWPIDKSYVQQLFFNNSYFKNY